MRKLAFLANNYAELKSFESVLKAHSQLMGSAIANRTCLGFPLEGHQNQP